MLITRKSMLSGIERTIEIPVTKEQIDKWESGALAQEAFPNITPTQREFIMTGVTDDEWDNAFPDEDDF